MVAGVYESGTFGITAGAGALTLNGSATDVWIFKANSTLITSASSTVVLSGGAQACNVFWKIGSSATLGASSTFHGTILANTSISVGNSATVIGRLLAGAIAPSGAVTLDNDTITVPLCLVAPTATNTTTSVPSTATIPVATSTVTATGIPATATVTAVIPSVTVTKTLVPTVSVTVTKVPTVHATATEVIIPVPTSVVVPTIVVPPATATAIPVVVPTVPTEISVPVIVTVVPVEETPIFGGVFPLPPKGFPRSGDGGCFENPGCGY